MFSEFAPKYWAAGLPAMPLRPSTKIPALNGWQAFCAQLPSEEQRAQWIEAYPDGNMGLPLGPASGIVALDLDSEDPRVAAVLAKLMPASPWKRIGKKGAVYAFKYAGERTYRIKDEDNNTILEVLSRGAQIVLPPSIHPDTQQPYISNTELTEVLDKLVPLPVQFEQMIRQALIDAGLKLSSRGATKVSEWVPAGGRDSALIGMAGLLARGVLRKERTLLEAINEVEIFIAGFTEKVVGDEMDPDKGRKKVLEFLRRDIVENKKQLPAGWDAGMTPQEIQEMREYFGEQAEEWELQQILDHLDDKFKNIPKENTAARQDMIEDVLFRVSRSEQLSSIDIDIIVNFIQAGSGRMLTSASIRKRLKELSQGEIVGVDHTEIAQALIRDLEREGDLRFDRGRFFQWYGSHWREIDESEVSKRLALEFGHLPGAKKASDHRGIITVAQKLASADLRTINLPGINFANGYLTDDMQLLDHDPRYGATYVLPYRYLEDAPAPATFMGFLDTCWGQDPDYLEKVQAVREAIAATLFQKTTTYQRAFCLFGVAGSGKSTLMDIVKGLVPEGTICSVSPQDWSDKFLPTMMNNKLINACGELSESQMIPGGPFKMIVEGTEMHGQLKGGQIFSFRPLCAQWFATNHLPRSRDTSAGFNRRWLILHFAHPCPRDQMRRGLADEILSEEREAIVAWAVGSIQDLIRQADFTLPRSHLLQINEVASQNNSVRFFLTADAGVRIDPVSAEQGRSPMLEKDLYGLYFSFCRLRANVPPVQLKRFRMIMQDLQSELGFQLLIDRSSGLEAASYTNITPVRKAEKSR